MAAVIIVMFVRTRRVISGNSHLCVLSGVARAKGNVARLWRRVEAEGYAAAGTEVGRLHLNTTADAAAIQNSAFASPRTRPRDDNARDAEVVSATICVVAFDDDSVEANRKLQGDLRCHALGAAIVIRGNLGGVSHRGVAHEEPKVCVEL